MKDKVKKIVLWVAGVLLAAGVIGTTTYKLISGEESSKDALNKVSTSAQMYAADTVKQIINAEANKATTQTAEPAK